MMLTGWYYTSEASYEKDRHPQNDCKYLITIYCHTREVQASRWLPESKFEVKDYKENGCGGIIFYTTNNEIINYNGIYTIEKK